MAKKRLADVIGTEPTNRNKMAVLKKLHPEIYDEIVEAVDKYIEGGYVGTDCETKTGLHRAISKAVDVSLPSKTQWSEFVEERRAAKETQ